MAPPLNNLGFVGAHVNKFRIVRNVVADRCGRKQLSEDKRRPAQARSDPDASGHRMPGLRSGGDVCGLLGHRLRELARHLVQDCCTVHEDVRPAWTCHQGGWQCGQECSSRKRQRSKNRAGDKDCRALDHENDPAAHATHADAARCG